MFESMGTWLTSILGEDYQISRGSWVETPSAKFVCALIGDGGPAVSMDTRRPRFKVILVGPRSDRSAATRLLADAESLACVTIEGDPPEGSAAVQLIGEIIGPGYTKEDRAWCSIQLQLIV